MRIRIIAPIAIAAAATAIGVAPTALAADDATATQGTVTNSYVATPGPSAQDAATLQQPFDGDTTALLFHRH
jgi:hypothetical protein